MSDQLDTLGDDQKTAVFFNLFSKELLNDLEYRFKISIDAEQKVEEVIEKIKEYLKGQRSMVLARYNLFTRRQQQGETFEEWYCKLRRLYDLAEAEGMSGDDVLTVLITTGIRDEKARSKIFEDLKTQTLDDTVKLIERMVYAKDTNARIEKRKEDSKIAAINSIGNRNRPSKISYQKEKEVNRYEKAKVGPKDKSVDISNTKCKYCGRDRHASNGKPFGWRDNSPETNSTCKDCRKPGHFGGSIACNYSRKINCIKIESINSAISANVVEVEIQGPEKAVKVEMEADTGANINVFEGDAMQYLDWVDLQPTKVRIKGYDGVAKPCLGEF